MATVYGVNRTKMNDPIGSNILDQGLQHGKISYMHDTYEAVSLAASDVIEFCDLLPIGSSVINIKIWVDDMLADAVVIVGDATDTNRYVESTTVATGGTLIEFPNTTETVTDAIQYKITGTSDQQLQMIPSGTVFTGKITFQVQYVT